MYLEHLMFYTFVRVGGKEAVEGVGWVDKDTCVRFIVARQRPPRALPRRSGRGRGP